MKSLDLSDNDISTIAANAFQDLISFESLKLNGNTIISLQVGLFSNNINLRKIDLSDNDISTISANAFVDLVSLESLVLRNNDISTISANVFGDLVSLKYL
ncbi:Hypothetical predicted protein [Mytilus galloprovincialis]|uniref:Uncharacterized protein n=1 Tax=Mytilus galloprovincialis TaxID=29158 RepID=A0A8B6CKE5_MYTGA|nr:Hypothetical predicted protein [Mytilus galloprovincialis]